MPEVTFLGCGFYRPGPAHPLRPRFAIRGIHFSQVHPEGLHLEVDLGQLSDFSDLALLRFILPPGGKIGSALPVLHAVPPREGSRIRAYGFRCEELGSPPVIEAELHRSEGRVREICWEKHDDGFLNFPVFRTDARLDGGMSGGPVYSEAGLLCGIVCAGMGPTAEHPSAGHYTHVANLYPPLGSALELDLPGRPPGKMYSFGEMIGLGVVNIRGHEQFTVTYDADTGLASDISIAVSSTPRS